ncbi:MAG: septal ring lytic transglycosylase RlpA family protein [Cyanobacteria bacterium P01_F01_bin.53]
MDLAPALPPTQGDVPVVVATATDLPSSHVLSDKVSPSTDDAVLISQSPDLTPNLAPALTSATPPSATALLPAALTAGITAVGNLSKPSGFLASSQLPRSFSFVGQAFRSAKLGGMIERPQYSATIPIQWARSNDWKSWASVADIQVSLVEATGQRAALENNDWASVIGPQCMPQSSRDLQDGPRYRLSIRDKTLGYVADEARAYLLAQQLKHLVRQTTLDVDAIAPYPAKALDKGSNSDWVVGTSKQNLFSIDASMAEDVGYSPEWAAVAWANNLRLAFEADPLTTGSAQMTLNNMETSGISIDGEASWYGPYFHGRATANGETYDQYDFTVAHKSLPFGTHLKVRNLLNDKTVVVRVNDRGPYAGDRSLDLSRAAADCLGSDTVGVIPYEAAILKAVKSRR